ncbi:unnamed protein product [Calypogeia fissa]
MTAGTGAQTIESGHQDVVHDVQLDYYGKRMATCSSDRSIKVFPLAAGAAAGGDHQAAAAAASAAGTAVTLRGHDGPVWQVAWAHPKFGSIIASCSYDRKVIIWKEGAENEWTQAQVFQEHEASVNSVSWAPHEFGLVLAAGSSDGTISVFTHKTDGSWEKTKIEQAHPVGVTSVSWAPSSAPGSLVGDNAGLVQKLASGGCDNTAKVWKCHDGNWRLDCFPPLSKHSDWVRDVAWAPNLGLPKSTIASASQDGTVVIWTQGKEGDQWEGRVLNDFQSPVWRVSWSLTGNILAVADSTNRVSLWKEAVDGEWSQVTTV